MPASSKRGLVAPQNTFLERIIRKLTSQNENQCSFLLANSQLWDWPIVYASDGFCYVTGISRSEIIAQSCVCEFMHGHETDQDTVEKFRKALREEKPGPIEIELCNREGMSLWFIIQIVSITNNTEESLFFLLTFTDITADKNPTQGGKPGKFTSFFTALKQTKENITTTADKLNVLSESELPSKKSKVPELLNLQPDMLPKYHHEEPKTPRHIILHYSPFKILWDWVILILTFYTAIIVPFNVAFQIKSIAIASGWLVSDSIVDVIFLVDIVMNFITTFVGPGGEVISDPKIIRMNYIKSWFFVDLLSCLPYDLFNHMVNKPVNGTPASDEGIASLFSSLKVARLLRLGRIARKLDHYIEYGGAMLVLLVCFFGLSGHWLACIWYTIGSNELTYNGSLITSNWLVMLGEQINKPYFLLDGTVTGGPETYEAYIAALYFTMTSLTSVGFGNVAANTTSEQIFCVLMLIFGALLYATIFGNVTTIIQQMYAETNRYHDMLNSVREFLKLYQIPDSLSERILDYIVSTWSMSKGIDTNKVLNYCPKDMKADICIHLNRKVFNDHSAFRLASDSCLRALAVEFVASHCAPSDMIFHQGESIDTLNFVISGTLEVMQNNQVIAILSKGDVFGDIFWENSAIGHSTCHVRALTYCDLNSIKRDSLLRILNFHESFAASFIKKMTLTFNLRKRYYFRKISDIEKEKQEAMERKNDPKWEGNLPEDHFVRQVGKKFKQKLEERKLKRAENSKTSKKKSNRTQIDRQKSKAPSLKHREESDCDSSDTNTYSFGNDAFVVMDSEKICSLVEAVALQREKIDTIEKVMSNLVKSVQNLTKTLNNFTNSNRNNNSNIQMTEVHSDYQKIESGTKGKICYVSKKASKLVCKPIPQNIMTADLIYVNETTLQPHPGEPSDASHSSNELELVDLENSDFSNISNNG